MDTLLKDLRYALRTLARSPGFTVAAIATLGLGIGATSLVFSLVNAVMLRPFPYANPDQLVDFTEVDRTDQYFALSYPNFVDYRNSMKTLSGLGGYSEQTLTIRAGEEPERLSGAVVSANMFDVLGLRPVVGRTFRPEEESPSGERVVLLSHGLWERSFGSDPEVVGRIINVQGEPHTVIGVMPAGLAFPERAEAWVPLRMDPTANRGSRWLESIGRLKEGVTLEAVRAEANAVHGRLKESYPNVSRDWAPRVGNLQDTVVGEMRPVLLIMLSAVGFVLLIACANVANLLLARAAGREKEIAIRTALGAGRVRLVRQLLTESLLLGIGGGVLGIILAAWWMDLLLATIPVGMPFWLRIEVDRTVLLFTLVTAVGTALVFGLVPALHSVRTGLQRTLKDGRGSSGSMRKSRLRGALVVGQLAMAMVLLVGGLLMVKSFLAMRKVDPGFRIENIVAINLELPGTRYAEAPARGAFYQSVIERVRAVPGIESAAAVSTLPIGGFNNTGNFSLDGKAHTDDMIHAQGIEVTSGYFETMSIPIVRGRLFNDADGKAEPVAIINRTMARRFFAGEEAVGKRIAWGAGDSLAWMTIVGVVADVNQSDVNQKVINPDIYTPFAQDPDRSMTLVVRTAGSLDQVVPLIRREVQALDANIPLFDVKTMGQVVAEAVWDSRLFSSLFGAFAAAALLLAAIGLYGVIAYSVAQRTKEIGVRVALGARPAAVVNLVVGQGLRLAIVGTIVGMVGAFAMSKAMATLLFGVQPTDAFTFITVPLLLLTVAVLASYIPARRALRVDPMTALRLE